jgi:hypothetical protein
LGAALGSFVQNNDGGFMHYLMKRNADLKKYFKILVLKNRKSILKKLSILV